MPVQYQSRKEAGRVLAAQLRKYAGSESVVFGVSPGGLAVAAEVARELTAPLDLLLVHTLTLPYDQHTLLGAIAEGNVCVLDDELVDLLDVERDTISSLRVSAEAGLIASGRRLRDGRPHVDVRGRTAIIVEEHLINAVTLHAALLSLHQHSPRRVVIAALFALRTVHCDLHRIAGEVITLKSGDLVSEAKFLSPHEPDPTDAEVRRMLGLSELARAMSEDEAGDER